MDFMVARMNYIHEAEKQILILRTYLADPHVKALYEIIYQYGYQGVFANAKFSKKYSIWEIMADHKLLDDAKKSFSLERFACTVMTAIWYHYYSPALICEDIHEKYNPLTSLLLGQRFFAIHQQIIDYWPFPADSPFAAKQRELSSHCDESGLHPGDLSPTHKTIAGVDTNWITVRSD